MKSLVLVLALLSAAPAFAAETLRFNFNNEELSKIIETYSAASGQKFVIDPGVRGKATILLPTPVTQEEAFNQLSSALALNGFAISKQGDTMIVTNSRNIQRNLIETTTELPTLKPERMVTYIITMKNIPAAEVNRELRIIPSRDGEMSVMSGTNQIMLSDWTSNIHRVAAILKEIDKKPSTEVAKVVEQHKKEMEKRRAQGGKKDPRAKADE